MQPGKSQDSIIVSPLSHRVTVMFQLKLKEHEKAVLKRYIENELKQPDFLNCKDYQQIKEEALLVAYFAGHGSADTKQYFVLNEDTMDKVFWDAEAKLIRLAKMCGNALKILVIYDTCREPIALTK